MRKLKDKRQARFPFKRNRLRCMRCVNENRKKRKRLRLNGNRALVTQAASRLSSITVPTQIHKSSVQVVKYKVVITTADPRNARRIKRSRAPLPIGNDCSTLRDGCRGGKNLKLHFSLERAPLPKNCSLAIGL